jgi:hypothetical protein
VVNKCEYGALVDDADRGKPKYWEKSLFHCHFADHKSYLPCSRIELEAPY